MKLQHRMFALAALALALAPRATAQTGDQYLLTVDTVHTSVQFAIEVDALGACVPVVSSDCPLVGSLDIELHGGVLPIQTAQYKGGDLRCVGNLLAVIPNILPSLPPLLEVDIAGLALTPHSPTVPVSALGTFTVNEQYDVLDGLLVVKSLGLDAITIPLIGMTSDVARTHGLVQIDANGIRVVRQLGNTLVVQVPALGIHVRIALRGAVEARLHYPQPNEVCPSSVNLLGTTALLDLNGTVSISRDDLGLACSGATPGARSIAILGHLNANIPFGNGTLCIGGPLARLGSLNLDLTGSGLVNVHLGNLGLQVGSQHILQVVYRDGVNFNLSNALQILLCP